MAVGMTGMALLFKRDIFVSVNCMLRMQEAFKTRMAEFVSHSRERQRYIRLRSQERRLQQLEADERRRLFGDTQLQCSAVSLSDPAVGRQFNCTHLFDYQISFIGNVILVKVDGNDWLFMHEN